MPISPIVLQRRHAELGRIRLGAKRVGSGAPMKLEQFRFTSHSERYVRDLAELYGGEPKPWDNNGVPGWEVYTTATSVPVIAVKGGLSQWMETWSGGGCVHRCDGENNVLTGELCNPEDRDHKNAKPTTRLSVMLPELEAIGVWRMESHGWNAAAEIPAVAELAQYVGDLVPANLHLVERRSVKDGKTSRFVVPVLDLQIGTARLKEIVNQKAGTAELAGAPTAAAAIEAGPSASRTDLSLPTVDDVNGANLDGLYAMYRYLEANNALEVNGLGELIKARADGLRAAQGAKSHEEPAAEDTVDAEIVDDGDADQVWQQILATAGSLAEPLDLAMVQADFADRYGMAAAVASASELRVYLDELKGQVAA